MNKYYSLKKIIKDEIVNQYETVKNFIEKHPNLQQTPSKLSNQLSPNRGFQFDKLVPICDVLGLEIRVVKKG